MGSGVAVEERDCEAAELASLLPRSGNEASARVGGRWTRVSARAVVGGGLALAACATIGVWTHKSKTLQEAWRPVPGGETLGVGVSVDGGIARWRTREVARLGGAGDALTGVTPTPTQMTALRALRLQIRNAMFNAGGASAATVRVLTQQFTNIVPEASALFPGGVAANVDELDAAVKTLMSRGETAAPASATAESEFREMIPTSPRPTVQEAMEDSAPGAVPLQSTLPNRKPLTSYESALFETKAAAVATTGSANKKHKGHLSNEAQTVAQNDEWEAMINSLDSSGKVISTAATRQLDRNNIFNRVPIADDDFVQYEDEKVRPAQERLTASERQPATAVTQEVTQEVTPPWAPKESAPKELAAAAAAATNEYEAPATEPATRADEDDSWVLAELTSAQPTPTPSPSLTDPLPIEPTTVTPVQPPPAPVPVPVPVPVPAPKPDPPIPDPTTPADPLEITQALDFGSDASPKVGAEEQPALAAPNGDDDAVIQDLFKDTAQISSTGELGWGSSPSSSTGNVDLFKPVSTNANVEAIASNIIDMIYTRKSGSGAAAIGANEDGVAQLPKLSKEEIAEALAASLTAITTDAVEQTAVDSARRTDLANNDPNAKVMADALVAHDKQVAARIAQILSGGTGQVASVGAATGASGDAQQLIMYEEQRRQREELEAMRRDLAALMANVQANYAMGVAQDRIDKTASAAAARIVSALRPAFAADAVAREGSAEIFDYPVLPSSSLSSERLRLDATDDSDKAAASKPSVSKTKKSDESDDVVSVKDDSGAVNFDWLASMENEDAPAASPEPAPKSSATSSSSGGGSGSQPSWLSKALTDEELTAQFVADETEDDGKAISESAKSSKSKKSKRVAARLGAFYRPQTDDDADDGAHDEDAPTSTSYIRALSERAERALRFKTH